MKMRDGCPVSLPEVLWEGPEILPYGRQTVTEESKYGTRISRIRLCHRHDTTTIKGFKIQDISCRRQNLPILLPVLPTVLLASRPRANRPFDSVEQK